jgi:hypothetical protein
MPGSIYDAGISGDGSDSLTGSQLWYAICRLDPVGGGVRELETGSPDHVLRAGWVAFGDPISAIGGVSRVYWRAVWWLDFVESMFTPEPSTDVFNNPLTMACSKVRWHIPVGGSAHLYVFGT